MWQILQCAGATLQTEFTLVIDSLISVILPQEVLKYTYISEVPTYLCQSYSSIAYMNRWYILTLSELLTIHASKVDIKFA